MLRAARSASSRPPSDLRPQCVNMYESSTSRFRIDLSVEVNGVVQWTATRQNVSGAMPGAPQSECARERWRVVSP